jgi:hypothetical protein
MNALAHTRMLRRPGRRRTGTPGHLQAKRVVLICLMVLATVNIWTGSPLLALWVGSRVQGLGPPTMLAIATAAVSLGVFSLALVKLLAWLDSIYGGVAGRQASVRRHVPWLRSMRGERPHLEKHASELAPLEKILIVTVVLVFMLFEIWFFFYSPSPIDERTGRDHDAPLIGATHPPSRSEIKLSQLQVGTASAPVRIRT